MRESATRRVIVAGGTGLIGRALARALADRGDEVVVLSRAPERARRLPPAIRLERWDGQSCATWRYLVDDAAAIVNLAGENLAARLWTAERKRQLRASRLGATRAIVEAVEAAERRPRVVVQASAVGYYGPRAYGDTAEDAPPGDDFLARLCLDWEDGTRRLDDLGVRRAIIRTGVVLSREGGALPRLLLPFRFFVGGRLGSGKQPFPWIHLADEVAAILFLIDAENAAGPFNLTAPRLLTNAELSRTLGRVLGRPAIFPAPSFALRLILGEMSTVLLDGQRAVPRRLTELGFSFCFADAESAVRDLLDRR